MKVLCKTSRSATFELENSASAYFSPEKFNVYLNGKCLCEENRNVFSVFGLEPDSKYAVEACGEKIDFVTETENGLFNIKTFGAYGDGAHDDTLAFHAVISCLSENSTLYVPEGIYPVKPLFLKSSITLYLDKGAVLKGSADRNDYPILPALINGHNFGTWQGEEADCFASLITAIDCKSIKIVGEGHIDCKASVGDWYLNHRVKRVAWRPRGVFLNRCNDVLLQGITVSDTPSWNIHPYFCRGVKLMDLKLKNNPDMPTTDGIDPDCCDGVKIVGVKISVGDDCVAIKSGTFDFAKKYKTCCKNIEIRNCLMLKGHGGVVIGSELSGGIENINVERCVFSGTDRGLRIKTRRGRGSIGKCGGITFSDIVMENVKTPFVINMYYNMGDNSGHTEYVWTTEKLPIDERTPQIGEFVFRNVICTGIEYSAGAFYGLPESLIESVTFENVTFKYADNARAGFPDMKEKNVAVCRQGLYFQFVNNVNLKNVTIVGQTGKKIILENVNKFNEDR